jgi:hypothetical protein
MSSARRTCRRPAAFRRVTVGAAETAARSSPSRGSTLQLLDAAMGATPQPTSSSAPTTSRATRFGLGAIARARPGTAAAAGMATSWRTGEVAPQQDRDPTDCQRSDRLPDSPSAYQTPLSDAAGRHLPSAPGQRSRGRLRATRCKPLHATGRGLCRSPSTTTAHHAIADTASTPARRLVADVGARALPTRGPRRAVGWGGGPSPPLDVAGWRPRTVTAGRGRAEGDAAA